MAAMFQSIVDTISGSEWSYAVVFGVALLDGFFPLVPSETTVIAAGVLAAHGDTALGEPLDFLPKLVMVMAALLTSQAFQHGIGRYYDALTKGLVARHEHELHERITIILI
jgi:membrane protein DedA with SNARE-associated domain